MMEVGQLALPGLAKYTRPAYTRMHARRLVTLQARALRERRSCLEHIFACRCAYSITEACHRQHGLGGRMLLSTSGTQGPVETS